MKSVLLISTFFFMVNQAVSATIRTPENIIEQFELKKSRYVLKTETLTALVFNMVYGQTEIISEKDRLCLLHADVRQIDLVFSDFPKGLDLKELNLRRIKLIQKWRKDLVSDPTIVWKIMRQTECRNEAEAKTLFHGIVVHYKGPQTEDEKIEEYNRFSLFLPNGDSLKDAAKFRRSMPDSTIFKIFERKKEWKNITVVADLTGSMSPYTAQLVLWFKLKLTDQQIKNVVFFNDGDATPDNKKIIGKTGGIYSDKAKNYNQVRDLALKTMNSGGGGDGPENDCEALLFAIDKVPDAGEYILIADNMAPVKDIELLYKINKPIRIILCGTFYGINVQYLNIARNTGGSVHTMEKDLENLIKLKEGEKFTFMGRKFVIEKGLIVMVR